MVCPTLSHQTIANETPHYINNTCLYTHMPGINTIMLAPLLRNGHVIANLYVIHFMTVVRFIQLQTGTPLDCYVQGQVELGLRYQGVYGCHKT